MLLFFYILKQNQFSILSGCKKVFTPIKLTFPFADCACWLIILSLLQAVLALGQGWFPGNHIIKQTAAKELHFLLERYYNSGRVFNMSERQQHPPCII